MKILLLTIAAMLAQAPSVPSPAETQVRIEGIVMGLNGPLAGAQVSAFWDPVPARLEPGTVPRATTSADGKFVIEVAPGAYRLTARAPGYVPQWYGAARSGPDGSTTGTVIRLNPQESLKDLTLTLIAEGILSGRVATTNGQPLVRIEVVALRKKFTAVGTSLEFRGSAQTNDRGEYRIPGLAAGSYIIGASGLNPLMIAYETFVAERYNTAAPVAASPGAYGPIYYPSADQSSGASAVEIQPGIEARNIDFVLPKRGVYTVRGRVIGSPRLPAAGSPRGTASVSIRPAYAEYSSGSIAGPNNPDGTFELTGVGPGLYWVIAQVAATLTAEQWALLYTAGADLSQVQLPRPTRGAAFVHVIDGDIEDVELMMVPGLEVSGQLSVDGERFDFSGRSGDFKLELGPIDPSGNGAPNRFSPLEAGGEFVYTRILPTEYRLMISALPAPFYVKEAHYGNIDALAETIRLTKPSTDRLNIVLARGTEVRGTLSDALGNQNVVLIPDGLPLRHDLYKTAATNADGAFTFSGVAPGNYKAFAWQILEDFQYFDEAFVARFQDRGTSVQVTDTTNAEIQVNLIR